MDCFVSLTALPCNDEERVVDLTTELLASDNYKINANYQHQLKISNKIAVGQQEGENYKSNNNSTISIATTTIPNNRYNNSYSDPKYLTASNPATRND